MTFVRIDGVPHHVVVAGSGPPVLLSAGLGMAWFDWDEVAALLAPHRTVVRFDRPGHGLSGPAVAPPTASGEAHRIAAVLDAVRVSGPVTVVGHSIAGFHAEAYARLHPDRTAALVLVDSSVEPEARVPVAAGTRVVSARVAGAVLAAAGLPAALGPLLRRATVRLSRTGGADPAPRALVRRCYRTSRVWRGLLLENARYRPVAAELLTLRDRFPLPPIPVTVLAAAAGGPSWLTRQRGLADTLRGDLRVAEGAGHLVMLDAAGVVAETVLRTVSPTPPVA
ncbi:alpha/beta fold hydrolase [Streptomyces sp. NPDC059994]|uniref:alpha/beta fold hydrolase n=1 Tax=Streptomyces sp. NPDC059994 TaxID=3347029 RepID=UPI0036A0075A